LFPGTETTNDIDKNNRLSLNSILTTKTNINSVVTIKMNKKERKETGLILYSWREEKTTIDGYNLTESETIKKLDCSLRTLQRYRENGVKNGENIFYLSVMKKPVSGSSIDLNFYSEIELNRLIGIKSTKSVKLTIVKPEPITRDDFYNFAEMIKQTLTHQNDKFLLSATTSIESNKTIVRVPIAQKLLISLADAVDYSGLSKKEIKNALEGGKIQGKKTSEKGVWKIKRLSLDQYVTEL
jgi:hypothetical protein